jgi:hypothetical protein
LKSPGACPGRLHRSQVLETCCHDP